MTASTLFTHQMYIRLTDDNDGAVWTEKYAGIPLRRELVPAFAGADARLDPERPSVRRSEPAATDPGKPA